MWVVQTKEIAKILSSPLKIANYLYLTVESIEQ